MNHNEVLFLVTMGILLLIQPIRSNDDELRGPLIKVKPDGSMYTTAEIIEMSGYKSETHEVITEDGYCLTIFRAYKNTPTSVPVLLQHGFMASSDCWVTDPRCLTYRLAERGFDVWLSNIRGNAYGRKHKTLKPEDKAFWDFSWHEMGTKDMPAVIDYILNVTNQKHLHYLGHSMGTTIGYVMTSTKPETNDKLLTMHNFSPIVHLEKLYKTVGKGGMVEDLALMFMDRFRGKEKLEYFPRSDNKRENWENQINCEDLEDDFVPICEEKMQQTYKLLGGHYLPAGSSFKSQEHFYQSARNGVIKCYNYSTVEENQKAYGSDEPCSYTDNFNKVTVPTYLWSADEDLLVTSKDVDWLASRLPNKAGDYRIKEKCFNHVAFLYPYKKSCLPVRDALFDKFIDSIENK